ncbi:MAG: hypothetical protein ACRENB_04270 [Gemmatimonadales bacterium]
MTAGMLTAALAALLVVPAPIARAQEKSKLGLDKIPPKVMNTLKTRFPGAEIAKWTREEEDGVVIFDFEFRVNGRNFEADIREDGGIHNWEQAITPRELPDAVTQAVERRYPRSTLREIMRITAVKIGKESLEGYEIVLATADRKDVEVTVSPTGKILEDKPAGQ